MTQFTRFVGIDVSMKTLDVHVHPDGSVFSVPNTAEGLAALIQNIEPGAAVAVEASGGYERKAVLAFDKAGFTVYCLHPANVRAFARLQGRLAKTDRIDACLIARAAEVCVHTRAPYRSKPGNADLKEMAACRRMLINQRTELKGQATRLETDAMRQLVDNQIAAIDVGIDVIETAMVDLIDADPGLREHYRRLRTAPGTGPVLAATLLAYMPEIGALSSRQAASLVGVAPHPRQSGATARPGRCMAGRTPVRTVLYMAAIAAIRCKASPMRGFFERLRENGKPFKLAIVAVMRKLIVTLNAMIKNHQDWTPQHIQ